MAHIRKIRKNVVQFVTNGTDEVEEVTISALISFLPPKCETCKQEMKNVFTTEGKRRYQCMTWGCTNHRMYDEEGNELGQSSGNSQKSAA